MEGAEIWIMVKRDAGLIASIDQWKATLNSFGATPERIVEEI
jgi:hypothetical protein